MNSFLYRKILTPRKLKLDYISPPICEGEFSATGTSEISLQPIYRNRGPTGLIMESMGSFWRLRWNAYPGALCYSVYKLSFSDYILVAECIDDPFLDLDVFGTGTYIVTVITDDGESDPSDPVSTPEGPIPPVPPPPVPPGCDATGDPVPVTFLRELDTPELIETMSATSAAGYQNAAFDWGGETGQFEIKWESGHVSASCLLGVFTEQFVPSVWGREHYGWGDSDPFWDDPLGGNANPTVNYGCFGPPPCDPEALILAARPDGILATYIVSPLTRDMWATLGLISQEINVNGTPNSMSCGGACTCDNDGADPALFKVNRTHEFIPQPATTTIQNLVAQASLIDGASEPWGGVPFGPWNGIINGTVSYMEAQWNNTLMDPLAGIGQSLVTMVIIDCVAAGGTWSLEIYGQRYVGGVPQAYLMFEGTKTYGETPLGAYTKVTAANPACPACLIIV